MPPTPLQIRDKLLKGIDEEYNITNASIVEEVIAALEAIATRITREDLETTRLAKHVNDLRRKTSNKDIATRSRKLIKLWQPLVPRSQDTPRQNNTSPALSSHTPAASPALQILKQSGNSSNNASPALPNRHKLSPALAPSRVASPAGRAISPAVRAPHKSVPPAQPNSLYRNSSPALNVGKQVSPASTNARLAHQSKRISPAASSKHTPTSTLQQSVYRKSESPNSSVRSNTPTVPGKQYSRPHTPTTHNNLGGHNGANNHDSNNRGNTANRKRRRSDDSMNSDASSARKVRLVNGDSAHHNQVQRSLPTERTKTPKVKTTIELITELQSQKRANLQASDTITKIFTNQIRKEKDDATVSLVPAGAKPRPRKTPGSTAVNPPEAPADLRQTKNEIVQRFLQHTVEHQSSSTASLTKSALPSDEEDVDILGLDNGGSNRHTAKSKATYDTSVDPYSLLPPINYDEIVWSDEEEDVPIRANPITGEYPADYEVPTEVEDVTDGEVHRILSNDWHGVNGTTSLGSEFHPWTETFSINRTGEAEDEVFVLPYVDID